jgi:hypothetical protein
MPHLWVVDDPSLVAILADRDRTRNIFNSSGRFEFTCPVPFYRLPTLL